MTFGSLVFVLVMASIGILAAATLFNRRRRKAAPPLEALPLDRQVMRGLAVTHAVLFTILWAILLYEHLLPNPWGAPNVMALLLWLPLFVAHMAAQAWLEARARFNTVDTARERELYREGYADGRRDAARDRTPEPLIRLTDEGEFMEDYPDLGEVKRKRNVDA